LIRCGSKKTTTNKHRLIAPRGPRIIPTRADFLSRRNTQQQTMVSNHRITIDPAVCHAEAVIRGTRVQIMIVIGSLTGAWPQKKFSANTTFPRMTSVLHRRFGQPRCRNHGLSLKESAMAAKKIKPTHPGAILRAEFMEPVGITAYALAKALHVPLPRVNDIAREKRAISPEMAVLLSTYFGTSDSYWINLQGHYDLLIARDRVAKQVARIQPHPHDATGALQPI
jgi:antitoxin HigA-1